MTTLTHLEDVGRGAGVFAIKPIRDEEYQTIPSVLRRWYGPEVEALGWHPHDAEAGLRDDLARPAPGLAALGCAMRERLDGGYSGVIIPEIGLAGYDNAARYAAMFALGLFVGSPTATDRLDRRVVWDIRVRDSGYVSTFSQHAGEADFHTDTQYYAEPERYIMLYCMRAAACGGGVSTLRDVRCIEEGLSRSEDGRWALDYLSQTDLPFRIPAVFTSDGSIDAVEVTLARVFGDRPRIRYRTDTLDKGFQALPAYDRPDTRRALAILQRELDDQSLILSRPLPTDGVIIVNNHEALHGRSAFSDPERHLLRIRIADGLPQNPAQTVVCSA